MRGSRARLGSVGGRLPSPPHPLLPRRYEISHIRSCALRAPRLQLGRRQRSAACFAWRNGGHALFLDFWVGALIFTHTQTPTAQQTKPLTPCRSRRRSRVLISPTRFVPRPAATQRRPTSTSRPACSPLTWPAVAAAATSAAPSRPTATAAAAPTSIRVRPAARRWRAVRCGWRSLSPPSSAPQSTRLQIQARHRRTRRRWAGRGSSAT